jgi:hypothetical protein
MSFLSIQNSRSHLGLILFLQNILGNNVLFGDHSCTDSFACYANTGKSSLCRFLHFTAKSLTLTFINCFIS